MKYLLLLNLMLTSLPAMPVSILQADSTIVIAKEDLPPEIQNDSLTGVTDSVRMFFLGSEKKKPITAFAYSFFLGWLGLHRLYLGTRPEVVLAYAVSGGGLYVLWMVDTVLLFTVFFTKDISDYTQNPSLFMWR